MHCLLMREAAQAMEFQTVELTENRGFCLKVTSGLRGGAIVARADQSEQWNRYLTSIEQ
jgi:hypothetical protein